MMYGNYWGGVGFGAGMLGGLFGIFLIPLMIWSIVWKGWALWKAARNGSVVWFVVLLILNTVGILDILYIFVFGKSKEKSVASKPAKSSVRRKSK